jgi:MFS family permease
MRLTGLFGGIGRALSSRNYRTYWSGNALSLVGTWAHRVAAGWLTWELTHSATWLGIIAFAELFPTMIIAPIAGAIADKADIKRLMIVCQILSGLQAALLALLVYTDLITIEILFGLTLFLGAVLGFQAPVRMALVPSLVEKEELSAAIALSAATFNGARFVGPALAGVVIVWGGVAPAFTLNALSYCVFIYALTQVQLTPRLPLKGNRKADLFHDLAEGVRYVRGHFSIRSLLILLFTMSFLLRPFNELLPGFVAEVFDRGAEGLAMMTSAAGLGAMSGGLWLARRGRTEGLSRVLVRAMLLGIVGLLGFASSKIFWVALLCLVAVGFSVVSIGISTQVMVQNSVDSAMRARVMSLYGVLNRGGPALGALVMGWAASDLGMAPPVITGALLALIVWLLVSRLVMNSRDELENKISDN